MAKIAASAPDLQTQAGRLRWARERAGYASIRSAALSLGWNENTYKSHEQGIRGAEGIKPKHLKKYARSFGVSETWLSMGRGAPTPNPGDAAWAELSEEERATALRLLEASRLRA